MPFAENWPPIVCPSCFCLKFGCCTKLRPLSRKVPNCIQCKDVFIGCILCRMFFFFKLSAFRQQHLVCPEHSDWVKKSRIHQAKEESVWVLQDISRSYHRTSLPQHHIPSYFHAHRHCHHVYLLHQFTMSHHSWIISNHVRRLSRNLQEHIILKPISSPWWIGYFREHFIGWLVARWWLAGFPPGIQAMQSTTPNHQLIIGWQITVTLTSHVRMTSIRFQIKRTFKPSHLISSHFIPFHLHNGWLIFPEDVRHFPDFMAKVRSWSKACR